MSEYIINFNDAQELPRNVKIQGDGIDNALKNFYKTHPKTKVNTIKRITRAV